MEEEYYEVNYHDNQFTSRFLYSFERLYLAEDVIKKEYPEFIKVAKEDANHPYIIVSNTKQLHQIMPELYYCKKKD
jgi:hypothetical protein